MRCFDGTLNEKECKAVIEVEQNSGSDDSNMYLDIKIYAEKNGKKKELFDMETV